jgi:predicted component of type VI protein secretion system
MSDPGIVAAAIAAVTSAIVAFVTAYLTARTQRERLRTELKTQFMAEEAIRQLLQDERWGKRSFDQLKKLQTGLPPVGRTRWLCGQG